MDRWCGRVALVTGASDGIGEDIARQFVKHGMTVVGCARRLENLEKIQEALVNCAGKFYPIKCDVSNEDDVTSMFAFIECEFQRIDVCVCNAGVLLPGSLLYGETNDWRKMLDVNVFGVVLCAKNAVRLMRYSQVKDGHVIVISSVSGHKLARSGCHVTNFYSVTKHIVTSFCENLRRELHRKRKSLIRVTAISPGYVDTNFLQDVTELPKDREQIKENNDGLEKPFRDQDNAQSTGANSSAEQTVDNYCSEDRLDEVPSSKEIQSSDVNLSSLSKLSMSSPETDIKGVVHDKHSSENSISTEESHNAFLVTEKCESHKSVTATDIEHAQDMKVSQTDTIGIFHKILMEDSCNKLTRLSTSDVTEAVLYALSAPAYVDVNEVIFKATDNPELYLETHR